MHHEWTCCERENNLGVAVRRRSVAELISLESGSFGAGDDRHSSRNSKQDSGYKNWMHLIMFCN